MPKTVTVPPERYETTIRNWANRGLHITATGQGWTTLERPPRTRDRTLWRAVKLSILTLGIYPVAVLTWWICLAWWIKPLAYGTRVDRITIQTETNPVATDW